MSVSLSAQDAAPVPSAPSPQPAPVFPDKYFGYFAGYSYFRPFQSTLTIPEANNPSIDADYGSVHTGAEASISYFFSSFAGVQIEAGLHPDGSNDGFWSGHGGVVIHKPSHTFQPFAHFLGGATQIAGPNGVKDRPYYHRWTWTPSVLAGGGVDYELPFYGRHFSVRIVQADYTFFHPDFGKQTDSTGGNAGINALQLSAGLVFHPGWTPVPVTYTCIANPATVYPGDPVTVTGTASGLNPKKKAVYSWSAQGMTVKGDGPTATIDTGTVAPGTYPITGHVSEGKKPGMMADCTASLTVKPFEPPTLTCSADPAAVTTGGSSTVTATGVSPQNRPLTYTFTASTGQISGTGNRATLNVGGEAAGSITVTCNLADDKGQTASATTTVTVSAPVAPEVKHTQTLCAINFDRDPKRPTRVNNEAKACLDSVALSAKGQSDTMVVIVGEAGADEKPGAAARRAVNTKAYLTTEQGVDASRVTVRTGTKGTKEVESYLVPAGAAFETDITGTTVVDDSNVKAQPRKPLGMKNRRHHGRSKGMERSGPSSM